MFFRLIQLACFVADARKIEVGIAVFRRQIHGFLIMLRRKGGQTAFAQVYGKIGEHVLVRWNNALFSRAHGFKNLERRDFVASSPPRESYGELRSQLTIKFSRLLKVLPSRFRAQGRDWPRIRLQLGSKRYIGNMLLLLEAQGSHVLKALFFLLRRRDVELSDRCDKDMRLMFKVTLELFRGNDARILHRLKGGIQKLNPESSPPVFPREPLAPLPSCRTFTARARSLGAGVNAYKFCFRHEGPPCSPNLNRVKRCSFTQKIDTLFFVKSNVGIFLSACMSRHGVRVRLILAAVPHHLQPLPCMHELSVVTSLLALVREEMAKHGVQRLLSVRVRYGALTNIVPEALSFAFEALTAGTDFDGAVLEMEETPLELRCSECGSLFSPKEKNLFLATCPNCGSREGHQVESGRELYLQHLEAE